MKLFVQPVVVLGLIYHHHHLEASPPVIRVRDQVEVVIRGV